MPLNIVITNYKVDSFLFIYNDEGIRGEFTISLLTSEGERIGTKQFSLTPDDGGIPFIPTDDLQKAVGLLFGILDGIVEEQFLT